MEFWLRPSLQTGRADLPYSAFQSAVTKERGDAHLAFAELKRKPG
jgi:hypothetical protein